VASDTRWPLSFLIHDASDDGEASELWSFPLLQDDMTRGIDELVQSDITAQTIMQNSRDFAVLQRLFRLALSGQLGSAFPVERIVSIAEEVASNLDDTLTTPRWAPQTHSPWQQHASLLEAELEEWKPVFDVPPVVREASVSARRGLRACIAQLKNAASVQSRFAMDSWSACALDREAGVLERSCNDSGQGSFSKESICALAESARYASTVQKQMRLASVIGAPSSGPLQAERTGPRSCRAGSAL
jgi:hypothetical protein